MLQQQVYILNTILIVLDGLCVIVAGYSAYCIRGNLSDWLWNMENDMFLGIILFVMFLNSYIMGRLGLYSDRRPASFIKLIWHIFKGVIIVFVILATALFLSQQFQFSRLFLAIFSSLTFIFIVGQRSLMQLYMRRKTKKSFNVRKILVIGDKERGKIVEDVLDNQLSWGHEVVGDMQINGNGMESQDALGGVDGFGRLLRTSEIDEVIFAMGDKEQSIALSDYLDVCRKMGIPVRILPALWEPEDASLSVEICQDIPFLTIQGDNFNAAGLFYKRGLDIVGGLAGTIIFCLAYPFVGLAIKLDSPGPVIFKQKRVGRNGRSFSLYKFRTMYQDAEDRKQALMNENEMNGAMFKLKHDPRITRMGKWLRNTSMDEFPQFLNVIKGEMSLVGTRPPTPEEVEQYQPWHLKRISAKPGITGLWQVSGRNKITDFDKVVELDCRYMDRWRFSDDLKILFKTVMVVLQRKGAI